MTGPMPAGTTGSADAGSGGPLLTATISSPADRLDGWIVVDSLVDRVAMGGTRMTHSVTEAEVQALARGMTTKLALVGLPIGGAKAGIRAVDGKRDEVLRGFGRAVAPLLHGGVYLGCDLGTTHADRDVFFAAAGYEVLRDTPASPLPVDWTTFLAGLVDVTGFGASVATLAAIDSRFGGAPCRITVQGFGTVGRAVAKALEARGHRVVAVADIRGTVHAPSGLPVGGLLALTDSAGTVDRSGLPDSVGVSEAPEAWLDVDADVVVLAASSGCLRTDNLHRVRSEIVVEGGNLGCTPEARLALAARGIVVVPDVVASVGAAAAVGCALTGVAPPGLSLEQLTSWLFDWVEARVRRNSRDIIDMQIASSGGGDPVPALLAHRRKAGW